MNWYVNNCNNIPDNGVSNSDKDNKTSSNDEDTFSCCLIDASYGISELLKISLLFPTAVGIINS